jgi:hypothetical protein
MHCVHELCARTVSKSVMCIVCTLRTACTRSVICIVSTQRTFHMYIGIIYGYMYIGIIYGCMSHTCAHFT